MPWKEVSPMDQRYRFVFEATQGDKNFSELCGRYGISRKTGYKWLNRYHEMGVEGLHELRRSPRNMPRKTPIELENLLIEEKELHPHWGPKKLVAILRKKYGVVPPAVSTAGEILKRNGLTKKRRLSRNTYTNWPGKFTRPERPNHVWSADYKGWFRTLDGRKCFPLTISDLYSRYVLCLDAHPGHTHEMTMASFNRIFSSYGLPEVLRVDNGSPFAGHGIMNLSRLSLTWLRLGIWVEYIDPGHPEQNGCHERMHRTLKAEATHPPERTLARQQKRFDSWRKEFNKERPHEALDQTTPGEAYEKSPRKMPAELPEFEYPAHYERRRVRQNGEIKWENNRVFVGSCFSGSELGLDRSCPNGAAVYIGNMLLGNIKPTRERDMPLSLVKPELGVDAEV